MLLKRKEKNGKIFYIDRFSGRTVNIPRVDPLKKEPDVFLQNVMAQRVALNHNDNSKKWNNQRTVFIGDWKKLMKQDPEKRDKKEFIKASKRLNLNPYPLLNKQQLEFKTFRGNFG